MLEVAIAVTGLIMFIYAFTRVWTWVNGTMVQRQEAFQATRLAAGQRASAGTPVGYTRPPIQLIGQPDTTGGDISPGGIDLGVLTPPCVAAEPFYNQAAALADESKALNEQAALKSDEAAALGEKIGELTAQIHIVCSGSKKKKKCWAAGPFPEIDAAKAQLDAVSEEANSLREQAKAKADEAAGQIELGKAACP